MFPIINSRGQSLMTNREDSFPPKANIQQIYSTSCSAIDVQDSLDFR